MKPLPPIIPVRQIPDTFTNDMSPIEWLAKLTRAYNDIAGDIYDISVNEDQNMLVIKEKE